MLFHVLRPFFGKGSPEQNQIVLQLVVILGIKRPAELQAYANENLGIDCNGFVGNYLLHVRGQQPWTVLDGTGGSVGPNSLITQIFAQGNTVTNGADMLAARSYILVEVDAHGHVMPGGPKNPPGHIAITEPGRFQPHAFVTDSFGGLDPGLARQGVYQHRGFLAVEATGHHVGLTSSWYSIPDGPDHQGAFRVFRGSQGRFLRFKISELT